MQTTTVKAKSWNEIIGFYTDLIHAGVSQMSMLDLVIHIKESKVSERLFAYTSLAKLVISIYDPIQPDTEALHIEFDAQAGLFTFVYYSKPFVKPTFFRKYPKAQGILKFSTFLNLIRW